jgi:tetratricopeptide (TPR) repeat protein
MESLAAWQQRKPVRAAAHYSFGIEKSDAEDYAGALVEFDKAIELNPAYLRAYYERGGAQAYLGNYDSAIASCMQVIKIDPDAPDGYFLLGSVKARFGGDYAAAIIDLDKAIELDDHYADAYSNRGGVKYGLGESESARGNAEKAQRLYESAIEDFTQVIKVSPEDDSAHNNRGLMKFRLGKSEAARGNAEKAINLYESAIVDYTQAIQINPNYVDAHSNRATVRCKLGDIESARGEVENTQRLYHEGIIDYDKTMQLNNPEDADEKTVNLESEKGRNSTVRVMTWTGNFSNGSGFFVDKDRIVTNIHVVVNPGPVFVKLMDKATIWTVEEVAAYDVEYDLVILKIVGEGPPLPMGNSDMIQIGEPVVAVGYPGGRYKVTTGVIDSIQNSGKLIRMKVATSGGNSGGPALNSRDEVIGIVAAGGDLYSLANPSNPLKSLLAQPESSESLEKWRERDYIRAYGYFIRGQWKLKSNQNKEALADFENAIKLNPTFIYTYRWRGDAKVALGNYKEAIADYNKSIQLNPDDADAYRNRGNVHFHLATSESINGNLKKAQGLYEGAIENWTQAIKLAPEYADIYSNRGHTKAILGDYEGAIIDFDKAIQINPESAETYHQRGQAKEALGQKEAAKADFQKAKELDPNVGQ